jgi:RimJ/RimL family protein N-acetyltransferase
MPELSLVRVSPDEIPRLQEIAQSVWRAYYPRILSARQIEYMLEMMYSTAALQDDFQSGVIYTWIRLSERNLGFIGCEPSRTAQCLRLHKLYLLPEAHGQGYGQAALQWVVDLAKSLGLPAVELNVNKRNEQAIKAYERAGFRTVTSVVKHIGGGYVMDDFVMRREV